jgi:hypothetical protein
MRKIIIAVSIALIVGIVGLALASPNAWRNYMRGLLAVDRAERHVPTRAKKIRRRELEELISETAR